MQNNTFTAKNTFGDGLVMDFVPDNTQATFMTSALNATLLTFNGNEMSLQLDMGNGRVETARLPDGYIPVGTCEYGDIIYVVSYNPLINRSLIGCFPSPERNISSDEQSDLNVCVSNSDFQGENGEIKAESIKKELMNTKLNPGDKFMIYVDNADLVDENKDKLSYYDDKTTNRIVNVHVVAIEDSGKINYLDSDVKWYDKYFINTSKVSGTNEVDIDSYRDLTKSGYSIFQSKVSGKLALLIELEKINSFECTYQIFSNKTDTGNTHTLFWNLNWSTDSADPKWIVLTKSKISSDIAIPTAFNDNGYYYEEITRPTNQDDTFPYAKQYYENGVPKQGLYDVGEVDDDGNPKPTKISDITIHNVYGLSINKEFHTFEIPNNVETAVYDYEITPAMSYGLLKSLAYSGSIDFKKVGTGSIELNKWKYYTSGNSTTLTVGLDAYCEENKGIKEVVIEFYDNLGICAAYHIANRNSYSGTFTDVIFTDNASSNMNLTAKDSNDNPIYHKGLPFSYDTLTPNTKLTNVFNPDEPENVYGTDDNGVLCKLDETGKPTTDVINVNDLYFNDGGTLYSNLLYFARIVIKYCYKDADGNYDENNKSDFRYFHRYFWTNSMFNLYYYNTNDFNELEAKLTLDCGVSYTIDDYVSKSTDYSNPDLVVGTELDNLGAQVQYAKTKIKGIVSAGLQDTYNTFNLSTECVKNIDVKVTLAEKTLKTSNYTYQESQLSSFNNHDEIAPINTTDDLVLTDYSQTLLDSLFGENVYKGIGAEIYSEYYNIYQNSFKVDLDITDSSEDSLYYINSSGEYNTLDGYNYKKFTMENPEFTFDVELINFSKYIKTCSKDTKTLAVVKPLIYTSSDLDKFGMMYSNNKIYLNQALLFELYKGNVFHEYIHRASYKDDGSINTVLWENNGGLENIDYIHAENGKSNWQYSQYQGNDNTYFQGEELSKIDAYRDIFSNGFFIWTFLNYHGDSAEDYGYDENNGNSRSGVGAIQTSSNVRKYWNGNWKFNSGPVGTKNGNYTYGQDNFKGTYPRLGIGYKDSNGEVNFFNTYFRTVGNGTYSNQQVVQTTNYNYSEIQHLPGFSSMQLGHIIAEPFTLLYVYKNDEKLNIFLTDSIQYLTANSTSYNTDFVYLITCSSDVNSNILMKGFLYNKEKEGYLNILMNRIDELGDDISDISLNNVNIKLQGCTKTVPLLLNVNYKNPDFSTTITENYVKVYHITGDGDSNDFDIISQTGLSDSSIYYFENKKLVPFSTSFQYKQRRYIYKHDSDDTLYVDRESEYYLCPIGNITKWFKYSNGDLTLTTTSRSGGSNFYSIGKNNSSMIRHLRKDEILLPDYQMVNN